jgi:hypothetical protein
MSETLTERMKRFGNHDTFVPLLPRDVLAAIDAAFASGALAGARAMQERCAMSFDPGTGCWVATKAIDPAAVARRVVEENTK